MNFEDLLKKPQNIEQLAEKFKSKQRFTKEVDPTKYVLKTDENGNGSALIRFLPPKEGEEEHYVSYKSYWYQNKKNNRYYVEKSLQTFGENDPVYEYNGQFMGLSDDERRSKQIIPKQNYVSNIYVIKDPANPENEGKVFRFWYGQKIMEKLKSVMIPDELSDAEPIDPFHFIYGANFRLKQKKVAGYPNFDDSSFDMPKPLLDGDANKLREIYSQIHSLEELMDRKTFGTYEELKKKFDWVMDENAKPATKNVADKKDAADIDLDDEDVVVKPKKEAKAASTKKDLADVPFKLDDEEDDFDLNFDDE